MIVSQHLKKLITQPKLKQEDSKILLKLLDTTDQLLLALKSLGRPVEHWDDWIIITIAHKLCEEVRHEWKKKVGHSSELPTWIQLKEFLEEQYRISEGMDKIKKRSPQSNQFKPNHIKDNQVTVDKQSNCMLCKKRHIIFKCPEFKTMTPEARMVIVKRERLCFRCLSRHEDKLSCERENPCRKRTRNHHTWLHRGEAELQNKDPQDGKKPLVSTLVCVNKEHSDESKELVVATAGVSKGQALLETAIVSLFESLKV